MNLTTDTKARLRFLLLQMRNADDPMQDHEINCFANGLTVNRQQITPFDLLNKSPSKDELQSHDMVLLGGSGHYSAAGEGAWLDRSLDALREIHSQSKPTFASCWGFQAMARAIGGTVINDVSNAELGSIPLYLTSAGKADPIFGPLDTDFKGQAGHEDHVIQLPEDAVLLASSGQVTNQAYRFNGRPIYCTQFHPELRQNDLLIRLQAYPEYVERIAGVSYEVFCEQCEPTPQAEMILIRLIQMVFG